MNPRPAASWRKKLVRKILFDERFLLLRTPYLFLRALATLSLPGACSYLFAKLRSARRAGLPASIAIGRGLRVSLRDCRTDLEIFEQVMLLGDLLPENAGAAPEYIIDAGAHIGCSSLYYALKYPVARILAIEAEPSNFRQLSKNVAAIPAIRPLHAAVFHRSGQVVVTNPADQPWGFQVGTPDQAVLDSGSTIRAMTIAELIQLSGFPRIDILKLDIEGAEREIFATDPQTWLPRVRLMTVELHDRIKPGCTESFQRATAGTPHELITTLNNTVWINRSVS